MPDSSDRTNQPNQNVEDQGRLPNRDRSNVDDVPGNARDREMGRGGEPLGDRGDGRHTWQPPEGEQGISNRPGDEEPDANPSGQGA